MITVLFPAVSEFAPEPEPPQAARPKASKLNNIQTNRERQMPEVIGDIATLIR